MAIRFRSTDSVRGSVKSLRLKMRLRAVGLMSAILTALLVILAVCKVLISPREQSSFISYTEQKEGEQEKPREQVDLASGTPPPAAPPMSDVIVAPTMMNTPTFTMDLPPTMDFSTDSSSQLGIAGMGDGIGHGFGGSKKGGMGEKNQIESSFLGTFWDLKRNKDGKDSQFGAKNPYASPEVLGLESRFFTKFWDLNIFSPYYKSRQKLYATCFFMPNCLDKEACHAYDPDGKMGLKETRWVAIYRAKVKAPRSGRYRFVGVADSVMAVRFNGENVLACGLHDLNTATMNRWVPQTYPDANKGRELVTYSTCEVWNDSMGGFVAGQTINVEQGKWYDMQVLISEIGGRGFGFCLLIENQDDADKKKTKDGMPLLQLFRTALSEPTSKSAYEAMMPDNVDDTALTDIPYDTDSEVWEAKPVGLDEKMK